MFLVSSEASDDDLEPSPKKTVKGNGKDTGGRCRPERQGASGRDPGGSSGGSGSGAGSGAGRGGARTVGGGKAGNSQKQGVGRKENGEHNSDAIDLKPTLQ